MKLITPVFSPHAFRAHVDMEPELFPVHAPEGRHFYLVTPSPEAPASKKRYLCDIRHKEKGKAPRIIVTYSRESAKKWDNLRLAEAYARFLSDHEIFHHDWDFWITLEPVVYKAERMVEKIQVVGERQ